MRRIGLSMVVAALAALGMGACTGEIVGEDVVARAEARQPAEEGDLLETSVEPDAITLRYAGEAPGFAAGDVVWGTQGPGYLRRVVAVEAAGDTVRLTTTTAELGDAFERIKIDETDVDVQPLPSAPQLLAQNSVDFPLISVDGQTFMATLAYETPTIEANRGPDGKVTFLWDLPRLSLTIREPSGHVALELAADELRVEKELGLDFAVDWGFLKLDELRFIVDDHSRYSLQGLSVEVAGALPLFDQTVPLFVDPALAVLPVGPFVFTLGTDVGLGVDALLSAALEVHTTSDVSIETHRRAGIDWDGSYHPVDEHDQTVDLDFGGVEIGNAQAQLDAQLFLQGKLRFALWGVIGPELWGKLTPVAAHVEANLEGWNLALAARATGGLRFVMPFFKLDALDVSFGSWEQPYYTTSGTW
jgi:hypothetical protein